MGAERSRGRLALAGHLLERAEEQLRVLTEGGAHPRVREAGARLEAVRPQVVRAGGLGRDGRLALSVLVLGVATWAVAVVLRDVLGLPGGWTIAITLPVVLVGVAMQVGRLLDAVDRWVRPRSAEPPMTDGPLALLRAARRELVTLMRERAAGHPTAGAFDRLRRRDLRMASLSRADRDLCAAIHLLELWFPAAERPVER